MIPRWLRQGILTTLHDDPISGHSGVKKTYLKIKSRFFFPNMLKYVNKYVKSCGKCQERERVPYLPAGLLQPISVGGIYKKFGIDILGPFPQSLKDNKYIVVATKYFPRFAIIKALPDSTTAFIAMFVVENIECLFGCPKELPSDKWAQFRSNLMKDLLKALHAKAQFTTSYHPQCNGLTKRFNQTLVNMMSTYVCMLIWLTKNGTGFCISSTLRIIVLLMRVLASHRTTSCLVENQYFPANDCLRCLKENMITYRITLTV